MLRDPSLIPLSHEHQHALALCVHVRRELDTASSSATAELIAERIVAQFDSEMLAHFRCEEEILFKRMSGFESTGHLVAELISEHRRMAALVDALRGTADSQLITEFVELLTQHVRKEERILFEEAQRLLTREELNGIGALLGSKGLIVDNLHDI